MECEQLIEALGLHALFLKGDSGGQRANLYGADLSRANLGGANLIGANLRRANLGGANLSGAYLRGVDLSRANLGGANLRGADLSGADLSDGDLSEANLSRADLSDANLRGANLSRADLRGADLYGANLGEANLIRADLRRANLSDANLRGANLRGANLRGAKYSVLTVLGCDWGKTSRELCTELMAWDASAHPHPGTFKKWADGVGCCPLNTSHVERLFLFAEKSKFYKGNLPTMTLWELWMALAKERGIKTGYGEWENAEGS
jgi:uncharacterized protein YjbI with pentapeptide repeats